MADIKINEISQSYSYVIGSNDYCQVALPITACWGPGYFDPATLGMDKEDVLANTVWQRFSATPTGLENFVSTFRGPTSNYRYSKDFSYQMAVTLLTKGYDVLVCRLCPGNKAQSSTFEYKVAGTTQGSIHLVAKYPGTFGNNLLCTLNKVRNRDYWNLIIYVLDAAGVKTAVENLIFAFELSHSSDSIPYIEEIESQFVNIETAGTITDSATFTFPTAGITFSGGTDKATDTSATAMMRAAVTLATDRYSAVTTNPSVVDYIVEMNSRVTSGVSDINVASNIKYKQWLYTSVMDVYDLLKDKLSYNPNRVISPGWDDQDMTEIADDITVSRFDTVSPLHFKLMDIGYFARCATAYIDAPKSLPRAALYNDSPNPAEEGYAQKLSRFVPPVGIYDIDGSLWNTHSALFAPWGGYIYVGTSKYNIASPSFLALLIQRSMILNQSLQYEWLLPTSRKNNVKIGKLDYTIPKKILDLWQPDVDTVGGIGINAIANIPDLGISVWGDSTLFETPPNVYQALRNLSTRLLVNAIKNVVYRVGISITFNYTNQSAFSKFYVGCTPILDTMKNSGAIEDYRIVIGNDLDALGLVKQNSAVGKIYITPVGSLQNLNVDLICLPAGTDLSTINS